jgi:hypothetical protein
MCAGETTRAGVRSTSPLRATPRVHSQSGLSTSPSAPLTCAHSATCDRQTGRSARLDLCGPAGSISLPQCASIETAAAARGGSHQFDDRHSVLSIPRRPTLTIRRNTRVLPSAGKMHLSARRSLEQDFLHLRCCVATVAIDRTVKPSVADSYAVYTGHRRHALGPVGGAPRGRSVRHTSCVQPCTVVVSGI